MSLLTFFEMINIIPDNRGLILWENFSDFIETDVEREIDQLIKH